MTDLTYEQLELLARDAYRATIALLSEVLSQPEPTTPWSQDMRRRAIDAGNSIITRWEKCREVHYFPETMPKKAGRLRLKKQERAAIARCLRLAGQNGMDDEADTLRALLARTKRKPDGQS